jgi:hypothetical protein
LWSTPSSEDGPKAEPISTGLARNGSEGRGVYSKVVKRRATGLFALLPVILGAVVVRTGSGVHLSELSRSELSRDRLKLKPPPEPAPSEEDYGEARHKPCARSETPIPTIICDVLRTPDLFAEKCVQLQGRFLSDGLEHSVIVDESCGKMGLEPWATDKITERLDEVIWQPGSGPGTFDRRITGLFIGRFVWRPHATCDVRVLEISEVNGLKVQKLRRR